VQPLVVYLEDLPPTPVITATPRPGTTIPAQLLGNILFYTNRNVDQQIFAYDPPSGRLALVTQSWPYQLALNRETTTRDGRFQARVHAAEGTGGSPQVFIFDTLYGVETQITHSPGWCYDPVFSPDGSRIAYVSSESGNDEIYTTGIDGSNPQRLTTNVWEWDKHPSWSPDGRQIVFVSNRDVGRRQLWIMNADGSEQRPLFASPQEDWDPVWAK
jgi:TolB protein